MSALGGLRVQLPPWCWTYGDVLWRLWRVASQRARA